MVFCGSKFLTYIMHTVSSNWMKIRVKQINSTYRWEIERRQSNYKRFCGLGETIRELLEKTNGLQTVTHEPEMTISL